MAEPTTEGGERMRGQIAPVPADAPELGLFQVLDESGRATASRVPQLLASEWRRIYRGIGHGVFLLGTASSGRPLVV